MPRREPVEEGHDDLRGGGAERGRPRREVAHPVALEPDRLVPLLRVGREVDDVVDDLDRLPEGSLDRHVHSSRCGSGGPDASGRRDAGAARADDDQALHVDRRRVELGQGGDRQRLLGPADVASDDDDGVGGAALEQDLLGVGDLGGARPGRRVVDREHEVGLGDGAQPLLDERPRLEPVGQAHHREVAADRRAGAGRDRLHGREPGQHPDLDVVVQRVVGGLEHGGRHAEDPGVATGHDGHPLALARQVEGEAGAVDLDGVAGRMPLQAGPLRHPLDVRRVARRRGRPRPAPARPRGSASGPGRGRGRRRGARGSLVSIRRRRPSALLDHRCAGTTIREKYGTVAGSTSATGSQRCSGIEARSTYSAPSSRPACSARSRPRGTCGRAS